MSVSNKLKEVLNNITEQSQYASIKRGEESAYDLNRGLIPLAEAYYNLNEIRDQLKYAIEKGKLDQMPISLQLNFTNTLTDTVTRIANLSNGIDEVVNIVNQIELVYSDLYMLGISKFSDEYVGFESKSNQLKHLLIRAEALINILDEGINQKSQLDALIKNTTEKNSHLEIILEESKNKSQSVNDTLSKAVESHSHINSLFSEINGTEKLIKDLLAEARSSDNSIKAAEVEGKKLGDEIEKYKENMLTLEVKSVKIVEDNKNEIENLVKELGNLEGQIRDKIQKATGYSLFNSFQTRKDEIKTNRVQWLFYIGILIALAITLTLIIGFSQPKFDIAFYLKISVSLPIIYAISFCTVQYSRERKLEEEYAFKSNISISLVPYKELIEKLSTSPDQQERYTSFLIDSIEKVFTSPTSKIFGSEENSMTGESATKQLANIMETLTKPIEPVAKLFNKK